MLKTLPHEIPTVLELFLNVFSEFSDKNNIILKKKDCCAQTCYLLCKNSKIYLSATRTLATERYLIDTNTCISDLSNSLTSLNSLEVPFYLGKKPNNCLLFIFRTRKMFSLVQKQLESKQVFHVIYFEPINERHPWYHARITGHIVDLCLFCPDSY